MQIRMHTLSAGPAGILAPGRVYDLPEAQAQPLIAGGYAEAIVAGRDAAKAEILEQRTAAPAEAATIRPAENAARPAPLASPAAAAAARPAKLAKPAAAKPKP